MIPQSVKLNDCPAYQAFIRKLDLASVSIIFSSYFIEKPASTFGHTFFRLRSSSSRKQNNDLLDYGVDFAAKVDTNNPIAYGIKGLFGGFKGEYSMMPYYVKVKEYNNMESRDLWDYEINLSEEELNFFQDHLFEMNRAYFKYYYIGENCSYHILAFLDAIRPQWNLMDELGVSVPPVDTIYALYKKTNDGSKIIKNLRLRPSSYTILKSRYKLMNKSQIELFKKLIDDSDNLSHIKDNPEDLFVLDTYNTYVDFDNADVDATQTLKSKEKKSYRNLKFKINSKRARYKSESKRLSYTSLNNNSPDKGHKTNRLSIISSKDKFGEYANFEIRGALHDTLDRPQGFLPLSTTELGKLKFAYNKYQENKFRLTDFILARIEAIRPLELLSKKLSYRLDLGFAQNYITQSKTLDPYFNADIGYSLGSDHFAFAVFLALENSYTFESQYDYIFGLGPKVQLIYANNYFSFGATYQYMFRDESEIDKTHEFEVESRIHLSKSLSLLIGYGYQDSLYQKGFGGLNIFY